MGFTSVRGKLNGFTQSIIDHKKHLLNPQGSLEIGVNKSPNKYSTTPLSYPLNVEGDPQQGHYISFYARVTSPAKLEAYKQAKATIESVEKSVAAEVGAQRQAAGLGFDTGGRTKNQIEAEAIGRLGVEKYDSWIRFNFCNDRHQR